MKKSQEDKDVEACVKLYGKKMDEMIKLGKDMYGVKVSTCAWLTMEKFIIKSVSKN